MSRRFMVVTSSGKDEVEMIDGRVYWTDDNWTTVNLKLANGKSKVITGQDADLARFLAIAQSSAGPA
jgi:hypothetical protein